MPESIVYVSVGLAYFNCFAYICDALLVLSWVIVHSKIQICRAQYTHAPVHNWLCNGIQWFIPQNYTHPMLSQTGKYWEVVQCHQ